MKGNHDKCYLLLSTSENVTMNVQDLKKHFRIAIVKNLSFKTLALHKNWSFQLRISSVNVSKYAGNCGFGHIYWRNPYRKASFFV